LAAKDLSRLHCVAGLKLAQQGLSQATVQGKARIMPQIIDVSRSARPFVIIKWVSVFLLIRSINGLINVPATLVKRLSTAQADVWDPLWFLIFFAVWAILFWVAWGNRSVISAIRRMNLLAFVTLALFFLFSSFYFADLGLDNPIVVIGALFFAWMILGSVALIRAAHANFRGYNGDLRQLVNWFEHHFATLGPRPPVRARRPLLGSALIAAGIVGMAASIGIPQEIWERYDDREGRLRNYFYLLPFASFILARMYFAPAIETLLTTDRRLPVLFLRSFFDERGWAKAAGREGYINVAAPLIDYSLESRLAEHFGHIGPFIAVGSPRWRGGVGPHLGAARAQLSNDEWQQKILSWMDISSAIVFMPALTHWTGWELEQIIARGHVRKTVLVFPEFYQFFPFFGRRKRDAELRLAQLRERLTGTPWFAAIGKLDSPHRLRALLLHEDGDVTAIMSRPKNRSSYHIAAMLAHHILITGHRSAIAPPDWASSHIKRA
jgi:hypothetical protein